MTPRQFIVVQLLLELLIPVLGYFFWKWDTSFILFFYALDWLAILIFNGLKTAKRLSFTSLANERKQAIVHHGLVVLSFVGTIVVMYFVLCNIDTKFNIQQRFIDFLAYKDMGMAQGYFLIPLVLINGYGIYNRGFLLPKMHERKSVREIQRSSTIQGICVFAATLPFLISSIFIHFPAEIILFSCVLGVFMGKLYFQISKSQ